MATTTNYNFNKPTVGGSQNTWGADLNTNWDSVDAILSGGTAIQPNLIAGAWQVGGVAITASAADINNLSNITATAAELNVLDGITASTTELNYVDGVTSNVQTQLNSKAPISNPTFSGTATIPTVQMGSWTVYESGSSLYFKYGSTIRMKLDSSGNLTVEGNVTAYGSL